jgi:hypothetical protein
MGLSGLANFFFFIAFFFYAWLSYRLTQKHTKLLIPFYPALITLGITLISVFLIWILSIVLNNPGLIIVLVSIFYLGLILTAESLVITLLMIGVLKRIIHAFFIYLILLIPLTSCGPPHGGYTDSFVGVVKLNEGEQDLVLIPNVGFVELPDAESTYFLNQFGEDIEYELQHGDLVTISMAKRKDRDYFEVIEGMRFKDKALIISVYYERSQRVGLEVLDEQHYLFGIHRNEELVNLEVEDFVFVYKKFYEEGNMYERLMTAYRVKAVDNDLVWFQVPNSMIEPILSGYPSEQFIFFQHPINEYLPYINGE